jgi:HK97 gp10 family phage protein
MPSKNTMKFQEGKLSVVGIEEFLSTMEMLEMDLNVAGKRALLAAGAHLEEKLKKRLSRPGGGRTYRTGKKGARYRFRQSSAPGAPPAVDTGRLRNSITHNVTGRPGNRLPDPGGGKNFVRVYVGTNVAYGYYLERGTRYVLPRPWFYITVQSQTNKIRRLIAQELSKAIRETARKRK